LDHGKGYHHMQERQSAKPPLFLAGNGMGVVYYTWTRRSQIMQMATDISGIGFGIFEEGPVDGGCADGADFICGPRGGVFSCRPCDFPQLDSFKDLQKLANQLVVGLGMANSPAIIVGEHGCEGGDILALDGRIGPCTKSTISKIVRVTGPTLMPPTDPILSLSQFKPDYEYIAEVTPELIAYFEQLVALSNAPKDVPAPSQQPIKRVTAPGSVPKASAPLPSDRFRAKPRVGAMTVGIFGALAAIGLIGTGVYYYRTQS
jgi:hypothetical protein